MTRRNLNVMGNALVNTFKFTANATMAMLFVAFLTACSSESINYHPTAASSLIGSMTEANGLGWATVDVEANATDINGDPISAAADVRYTCEKEVYVESEEELGLPVVLSLAGDNLIATGDGNVITRTENHSASKGVVLNVAGPDLSKGGYLGERITSGDTIRQEVMANLSDEAFATAPLPESFQKEWRDSKTSVVKYYRVYVKKAAPVEYRLRAERVEISKGKVYYNAIAEKSIDNGTSWSEMEKYEYFLACQYGTWKPNVTGSLMVKSYDFTTNDQPVEMTKSPDRLNEGVTKRWDIINDFSEEYRWSAIFQAPADAEGNTTRNIGGAQIVKTWKIIYHNPENNEPMPLTFTAEAKTTTHKVENGIYTRVVDIILNGEVVESQVGTVQLTLAQ